MAATNALLIGAISAEDAKRLAAMRAEEPGHAALGLEPRDVHVEVHPVDALDLQGHVVAQDLRHGAW